MRREYKHKTQNFNDLFSIDQQAQQTNDANFNLKKKNSGKY